jgi:hypothetical protein
VSRWSRKARLEQTVGGHIQDYKNRYGVDRNVEEDNCKLGTRLEIFLVGLLAARMRIR